MLTLSIFLETTLCETGCRQKCCYEEMLSSQLLNSLTTKALDCITVKNLRRLPSGV